MFGIQPSTTFYFRRNSISLIIQLWTDQFQLHFSFSSHLYDNISFKFQFQFSNKKKLPSTEVGPTTLAWPMTVTLAFNLLQATVMTDSDAKVQGHQSVNSEDKVETNEWTDRWTEAIALSPLLMQSVTSTDNFSSQMHNLSLIHIWRCRRIERCRSRWSPYH